MNELTRALVEALQKDLGFLAKGVIAHSCEEIEKNDSNLKKEDLPILFDHVEKRIAFIKDEITARRIVGQLSDRFG
ncbi:MAG: hypothetical protein EF807_01960 [Candidatus Methanolliviera hydrocarbonicum]|uniref:Uncharacterized protein n=1 Tax=Candidatus Methanolliviera hydrocarbonicum TaxID=2491085 RepID=A0A520KY20_9EURY|nr:MAG: hypothetical protein EF807_01960 [Candidatus Methanolliviera hydrocarbonicum]